jgi:BirA family transcriptional regulator, biotin operon repressor / biotin---[acetyl-CoA-carboxylase] ligase
MHAPLQIATLFPDGPLERLGRCVRTLETTESTNAYLLGEAGNLPDGTVATAEFQTGGHGRFGRAWSAPRGSSILLSILLHERDDSPVLGGATMLAALAGAEAAEQETFCRAALRWPNDIVIGGKKLGGVLAESKVLPGKAGAGRRALVIGIGLNCLQQRGHFSKELAEIATSLEIESAQPVDRAATARALIRRLDRRLAELARKPEGVARLVEDWTGRCEDLGARVVLEENTRRYTGTMLEVTDTGDLVVQLDDGGRRRFESATTTRIR